MAIIVREPLQRQQHTPISTPPAVAPASTERSTPGWIELAVEHVPVKLRTFFSEFGRAMAGRIQQDGFNHLKRPAEIYSGSD
jgi:hypothetical protein